MANFLNALATAELFLLGVAKDDNDETVPVSPLEQRIEPDRVSTPAPEFSEADYRIAAG